jgi:dipeptidyl aminopeptidase/acylaminoacyl peptidase
VVGVEFIRQFAEMKPLREAARSRCATLIVQGDKDETVSAEQADLYEKALRSPKRLLKKVIIADGDHTFNRDSLEKRVLAETLDWLAETL